MFNGMKVATRLAIAFGIVMLTLVSVLAVGITRMARIDEGLRTVTQETDVELRQANLDVHGYVPDIGQGARSHDLHRIPTA